MNILLTGAFKYTEEQFNILKSLNLNITFVQDERLTLDIDVSKFDAVVCNSLFISNDISLFENLKYIQLTSAGFDRVPLPYINEKNIKICNARGVYSNPIAEWVMSYILQVYKNNIYFDNNKINRQWIKNRNILELCGKTATIVGIGSIGNEIAKRLKAFNVQVLAVDKYNISSDFVDKCYSLDEIAIPLSSSDVVILTLPLTDESKHMFNNETFSVMKNNSMLINVSRGGIIKESDLINNLKLGKFLSVALDVFEVEPLCSDSELWDMENVIITPHNSFIGENNNIRMFNLIYENLTKYLNGIN